MTTFVFLLFVKLLKADDFNVNLTAVHYSEATTGVDEEFAGGKMKILVGQQGPLSCHQLWRIHALTINSGF